jgi:hypothetical protein
LISCIPSYWETPGNLTVAVGLTAQPLVISFTPHNEKASQFFFDGWAIYEKELQLIQSFDVQSSIDANDFGHLVYSLAAKLDPQSPLDPQRLLDSAETAYTAIFAVFSSSVLFQPASSPANTTVIVTESVSRLIVVPQVAYVILGIMGVGCLLTITLLSYASRPSILLEEPIGLLGAAAILHHSDIMGVVEKIRSDATPFDGRVTERMSEYDTTHVKCRREGTTPADFRIVVDPQNWVRNSNSSRRKHWWRDIFSRFLSKA